MDNNVFTVFWLGNDKSELIEGYTIQEALQNKYPNGTINIIDFYIEEDKRNNYYYDYDNNKWNLK